jgi:hypothetical protein
LHKKLTYFCWNWHENLLQSHGCRIQLKFMGLARQGIASVVEIPQCCKLTHACFGAKGIFFRNINSRVSAHLSWRKRSWQRPDRL